MFRGALNRKSEGTGVRNGKRGSQGERVGVPEKRRRVWRVLVRVESRRQRGLLYDKEDYLTRRES